MHGGRAPRLSFVLVLLVLEESPRLLFLQLRVVLVERRLRNLGLLAVAAVAEDAARVPHALRTSEQVAGAAHDPDWNRARHWRARSRRPHGRRDTSGDSRFRDASREPSAADRGRTAAPVGSAMPAASRR